MIRNFPIDHHTRVLNNCIPVAVENGLRDIGEYLDSRLKQTQVLTKLNRGELKKNTEFDYGLTTSSLFTKKSEIK